MTQLRATQVEASKPGEIYTGAENEPVPEVGKTGNEVHRLLTSSNLADRGHILVMDRYFNSILLSYQLHFDLQTGVIGTIQTNRKFSQRILCVIVFLTEGTVSITVMETLQLMF